MPRSLRNMALCTLMGLVSCSPAAPTTPPKVAAPAEQSSAAVEQPREGATPTEDDATTPFALEEGFQPLTLADFEAFGAEPETWSGQDDRIVCQGKPKGYLYSRRPYQNFIWKLEFRFPRPKSLKDEAQFKGNTGFLVYITGDHKLWPVCIEVQGKHVQMAAIRENGGAEPVTVHDDETHRLAARKTVGQWNQLEITSKNGALAVILNGEPVATSDPNFLSEGLIGIQAEDHPFEVRRMRIKTTE
ncbi:MAG: DUF1080 domain-containing protein [Planctomycetaceae bacterium]